MYTAFQCAIGSARTFYSTSD